jgi:hypothetical protein
VESHLAIWMHRKNLKIDLPLYYSNVTVNLYYLLWVDFGYFHNKTQPKHLPHSTVDLSKLRDGVIHLCGMNPIDDADRDVLNTLRHAPVKICAYLFGGTKPMMKHFQSMAHDALEFYQLN